MAIWPASLPPKLHMEGYQEALANQVARTQMDAGPAKMRRRFTAGVRPVRGMQTMTAAQIADLKTFFYTTLLGGSLPFDWTDPIPGTGTVSFRLVSPPQIEPLSGMYYRVAFDLEILP